MASLENISRQHLKLLLQIIMESWKVKSGKHLMVMKYHLLCMQKCTTALFALPNLYISSEGEITTTSCVMEQYCSLVKQYLSL